MGKKIFLILSIGVLLSGSTAAYLWHSITTDLLQLSRRLSADVEISYESISIDPWGNLELSDVTVQPTNSGAIRIAKAELNTPHILALYQLGDTFRQTRLPESFKLSLNGVQGELPLLGRLLQTPLPLGRIRALACPGITMLDAAELALLGYPAPVYDMILSAQRNGLQTQLNAQHQIRGLLSAYLTVGYWGIGEEPLLNTLAETKVDNISLRIEDYSFNNAMNDYCARQADVDSETYERQHLEQVERFLDLNRLQASASWLAAYRRFFVGIGALQLSGQPDSVIDFRRIGEMPLQEWWPRLEPRISVNGKEFEGLNKAFAYLPSTWHWPAENDTLAASKKAAAELLSEQSKTHYRTVNVADSQDYVRHLVKVLTQKGKRYTGQLTQVTDEGVQVKVGMRKGSISYWVMFDDIKELRVLSR